MGGNRRKEMVKRKWEVLEGEKRGLVEGMDKGFWGVRAGR